MERRSPSQPVSPGARGPAPASRARVGALLAVLAVAAAALVALGVDRAPPGRAPPPVPAPTAADETGSARVVPAQASPVLADPRAPAPPGHVRLSGRLVAARLEWGWVAAVPVEEVPPGVPAEEEDEEEEEEDEGDGPDLVVGPDGVPAVAAGCRDPVGAVVGRPCGRWAVPRGATRASEAGAFVLDLRPGAWVLLAGARGCRTRAESVRLVRDLEVTWSLDATPTATLAITCLAAGGEPLAGGLLTVELGASADAPPSVAAVGSGPWGEVFAPQGARGPSGHVLPLDPGGTAHLELPAGPHRLERAFARASRAGACQWPRELFFHDALDVPLAEGERRALTLRQGPSRGATVVVTARDLAGAPVPGALVRVGELGSAPASVLTRCQDVATTGPDGRATFLQVETGALFVVARRGTRCGRSGPSLVLTDAPRALDVVLDDEEPLGDLLVRVLDEATGAPLAEDDVHAGPADPDLAVEGWAGEGRRVGPGTYRLGDVPAGRRTLAVSAKRRASRLLPVEVAAGATTAVDVRLGGATPVAGRVVWHVRQQHEYRLRDAAAPWATLLRGWTDEEGRFRLEGGAGPGARLLLEVRLRGSFPVEFALAPPLDDLQLVPPAGEPSEVVVLDDRGSPVVGQGVQAYVGRNVVSSLTTGPDGRVRFLGTPPPGAAFEVDGTRHPPPPPGRPLVVRLRRRPPARSPVQLVTLTGTVLGPDGRPVVGARVSTHNGYLVEAATDEGGAFQVPVEAGQVAALTARRADLGRVALRVPIPEAGGLDGVVLRIPASAPARVRAPAQVTSVSAEPGEDADLLGAASDHRLGDGAFDLGLLGPGRWRVVGRDALLRDVCAREVEVAPPGPVVVTLE